ncbi:MAG: phage holin family protein [Thiohalobacteraceae bacterium]
MPQVETNESRSSRTIIDLLRSVTFEMRDLVRDEVQLAKTEIGNKVSQAGSGAMSVAAGGLIAFAGFLVLLDAAVVALANFFEADMLWLSPLIVGLVVLAIGYGMLKRAQKRLDPHNLVPRRTSASMRADAMMFKEKAS